MPDADTAAARAPVAALARASAERREAFFELRWTGREALTRGDAECLLGAAPRQGEAGGIHAGWRWDGQRLRACNDRYGFYPLFYARDGERLLLSPSLVRLLELGAPAELDEDALSVFLITGFFLGEDTPFRAIRALPPAARFTWERGELSVAGEYVIRPPLDVSWADAVEGYTRLFRQAIRRSLAHAPAIALPLSGGKDSRHILLELLRAGRAPELTVTFEQLPWQEPNLDVPIARELAAAAGVPHVVLPQPRDALRTELRKNLLTHLCSDEHAHYLVLADYLRGRKLVVYDGMAGDVLSESKVRGLERTRLFQEGRVEELARLELGPAEHLRRFLRPELQGAFNRERAHARLASEMARHVEAPNPFGSYRFWNRTRREIALSPFAILADCDVVVPYLDPDLFDFLAALPAPLLAERRLHTAVMQQAFPGFAKIPFDYERRTIAPARYPRPTRPDRLRERARSLAWLGRAVLYGTRAPAERIVDHRYARLRAARVLTRARDPMHPWLPRMLVYLAQLQTLAADPAAARSY